MKIELTDYYDVWGSERDGWEVNNLSRNGYTSQKFDIWNRKKVLKFLKKIGYLKKTVRENSMIWEETDCGFFLYQSCNYLPLCEIRLLEE